MPQEDQEAIGRTLLTLLQGFNDRNAAVLRSVYSDDADWVNAFGTVKRGRDEIVAYLTARWTATTTRCGPCNARPMDPGFSVSEMLQDANTEATYQP